MKLRYSLLFRCWIVRAPWMQDLYKRSHFAFDSRREASAFMQLHSECV